MKQLLYLIAFATIIIPISAQANEQRVEHIAENIYNHLKAKEFEALDKLLNEHTKNNTTTRHGTDTALTAIDLTLKKIDNDADFKSWLNKTEEWKTHTPENFLPVFFLHRLRHAEAWHYKHSDEWEKILQSVRRKYKKTLDNGYNNALKIIDLYPNKWRIHAHLVNNYQNYKLTAEELDTHFLKTQQLKAGEVSSMSGHVKSLSPSELGRDDTMIAKGIESILKKYPERNLSKPEYIDPKTKKEIQDQIFELSIGRQLLTARKYAEESDNKSTAPNIIPTAYKSIYEDLKKYYKDTPQKLKEHPLSLKRKAVWSEITQSYHALMKRFPKSGMYLTDYLELAVELEQLETIGTIITNIEKNDPNYSPSRLSPIQCTYYSSIKAKQRDEETILKMYESCKKATQFHNEEVYHYRTGWAARQIGNLDESNQFIEKALKFDSKNHIYLTDMCWNNKDLKRYDKALDYCDRAINIDRKHARAWLARSHIYYYGFKNTAQAQKDAAMYERLTKGE